MEGKYCFSEGTEAANVYLYNNDKIIAILTIHWTFDGVYYKYKDDNTLILSTGPKTKSNDFHLLKDSDQISVFKSLVTHFMINKKGGSIASGKSLEGLTNIIDLLV